MQRASAFVVKMLVRAVGWMPFRAIWLLSDALALLLGSVVRYRRRVVMGNLRRSFPGASPNEVRQLAKQFYRHFADILLESIKGLHLPKAELLHRFRYRNPEVFQPFFEKKQSVILLASHIANWEWGVLSIPLTVRHTVVGVYKPLNNPHLDAHLCSLRKKWGLRLTDMARAGRAVAEHRGQPCIFVLIADQGPSDMRNAHWADLLHQPTPFLHGPDKLARQTGYPVFYSDIERVRRGFYEVTFSPICEADAPLASLPLREGELTQRFAKRLEASIRRSPADWLWSHRRWKRASECGGAAVGSQK
jgi:KDO2-lipid IV(A) lauroyltransferase